MQDMTDPAENFRFRFTVLDLVLLTVFVAVLFALPVAVLLPLVSMSLLVVFLLGFFFFETMLSGAKRHWQTGAMQLIRKMVLRGFLYAAFVLVVGALSLLAKGAF